MSRLDSNLDYDAIVIGAGFGGVYATHQLKNELGLTVRTFEKGGDVGGTWYWNRYPGALSDSESHVYRLSFDKQFLQDYSWKETYCQQPEVYRYLKTLTERFNLEDNFQFNTEVTSAKYKDSENCWEVSTSHGETVRARFLVPALGVLSAIYKPDIPGLENFKGETLHTGAWPEDADLKGKRVGVIGTGSTGIQLITAIAPEVGHLNVYQRSAQYTIPLRWRKQSEEEIRAIKENYDEIWDITKNSSTAFGFPDPDIGVFDVSPEERERLFEEAWQDGNGFYFMFGVFNDITTNPEANAETAKFIRKKIKEIVKDPETARKLTPTQAYAKRPASDYGYYETFNRENVSLIDIKEDPIVEVTETGIRTESGHQELDVIVFATGFDTVDGNYTRMNMSGRGGVSLKEKWAEGSRSYLGVMETDFPNMFMVLGPLSPFTNLVPAIEESVNWITDVLKYVLDNNIQIVEPSEEGTKDWQNNCNEIANASVFANTASWIFGVNIPGKPQVIRQYMGGLNNFRKEVKERGFNELVFDKSMQSAE